MLSSVYLENFRSFGPSSSVRLAPLTLLFGENSAGKTSILHALAMLTQSVSRWDSFGPSGPMFRGEAALADLGSFEEVVHDHDLSREIKVGLGFAGGWLPLGFGMSARVGFAAEQEQTVAAYKQYLTLHPRISSGRHQLGAVWTIGSDLALPGRPEKTTSSLKRFLLTEANPWRELACFSPALPSTPLEDAESELAPTLESKHMRWQCVEFNIDPETLKSTSQILWSLRDKLLEAYRKNLRAGDGFGRISARQNRVTLLRCAMRTADDSDIQIFKQLYAEGNEALFRKQLGLRLERIWRSTSLYRTFRVRNSWLDGDRRQREEFLEAAFITCFLASADSEGLNEHEEIDLLRALDVLDPSRRAELTRQFSRSVFSQYVPIGPIRRPPARFYAYSGSRPSIVGRAGEALPDILYSDPHSCRRANRWLKRFGVGYEIEAHALEGTRSELFELRVKDLRRSERIDVSLVDVGFGVSQLLPIIVQSVARKRQLISIEQPEVHVHPRLQAEIGELLVSCIRENQNQFIVETHSEHLLLRVQKLIRLGKLNAEEVSVIYVSRGKCGAEASEIRIDSSGAFVDSWPGGFFPERIREFMD